MDKSAGYWLRLADGLSRPVPDTHENAVRANPSAYGVRGKPSGSYLRAALDAGWLRIRAHAGEVVFEHAQVDRAMVLLQIVRFVLVHEIEPATRLVVNSARDAKSNCSTTAAEVVDPQRLSEFLGSSLKAAQSLLARARVRQEPQ